MGKARDEFDDAVREEFKRLWEEMGFAEEEAEAYYELAKKRIQEQLIKVIEH